MALDTLTVIIKEQSSGNNTKENISPSKEKEKSDKQDKGFVSVKDTIKDLLAPLSVIGIGISVLYDAFKPILNILKAIFFVALYPILIAVAKLLKFFVKDTKGDERDLIREAIARFSDKEPSPNLSGVPEAKTHQEGNKTVVDQSGASQLPPVMGEISISGTADKKSLSDKFNNWLDGVFPTSETDKPDVNGKANTWIDSIFNKIPDPLVDFGTWIGKVFENIPDILPDFGTWVGKVFENIPDILPDFGTWVGKVFENIPDAWNAFTSWLGNIFSLSKIRDIGSLIISWIKDLFIGNHSKQCKAYGEAYGGTVASDGLYMLHAGETVNTRNKGSSGGGNVFNINITGVSNTDEIVRRITSEVSRRIGR